jgi:hypothetical protein
MDTTCKNRGHDERKTRDASPREICPGGVGFETRPASGGRGAVLVANSTRPVIDGVSVRVIGIRLGLQIRKPDDSYGNANGELVESRGCDLWRGVRAGVRSGPVSGELRLRNGAAEKRINTGAKSWLTAQRSGVKQAGTRRSQATWAAHSLLV